MATLDIEHAANLEPSSDALGDGCETGMPSTEENLDVDLSCGPAGCTHPLGVESQPMPMLPELSFRSGLHVTRDWRTETENSFFSRGDASARRKPRTTLAQMEFPFRADLRMNGFAFPRPLQGRRLDYAVPSLIGLQGQPLPSAWAPRPVSSACLEPFGNTAWYACRGLTPLHRLGSSATAKANAFPPAPRPGDTENTSAPPTPRAKNRISLKTNTLEKVRSRLKAAAYTGPGTERHLEQAFNSMDKDHSGELDGREVREAVRRCLKIPASDISDAEVMQLCQELDTDRSGCVSIKELLNFIGSEPLVSKRTGRLFSKQAMDEAKPIESESEASRQASKKLESAF